jgi:hypothetical protein
LSEFLEGYGVVDARRERRTWRIVILLVVLLVAGIVLYFSFRNWRENREFNAFVEFLQKKDYNSAYRLWGCDPAKPCRDYKLEKFLEDWGPQSTHADLSKMKVSKTLTCDSGIIKVMDFGGDNQVTVWVDANDRVLSYAPWGDSCRQPIVKGQ